MSHLKKCSQQLGVTTETMLKLVKEQEEERQLSVSAGVIPSSVKRLDCLDFLYYKHIHSNCCKNFLLKHKTRLTRRFMCDFNMFHLTYFLLGHGDPWCWEIS